MSRPKKKRSLLAQAHVRTRITLLREQREWTADALAQRMTDAGCPMDRATIYKIEKGTPPRTIDVDELVAFAGVFGLTVTQMLSDPDLELDEKVAALYDQWRAHTAAATEHGRQEHEARKEAEQVRERIATLATSPRQRDALLARMTEDGVRNPRWSVDHLLDPKSHSPFATTRKPSTTSTTRKPRTKGTTA
jgi:transcriptional regulator with XRE-family HTH domain